MLKRKKINFEILKNEEKKRSEGECLRKEDKKLV